jgi:carbamate kinase
MTRAVVTDPLGLPVKPIGPFLDEAPVAEPCIGSQRGWRVTVPSPRPARIVEAGAIGLLLQSHHVVAGGGGGVPVDDGGDPLNCVVDKDWVACLLAIDLDAEHLVFATDVDAVYRQYGQRRAQAVSQLSIPEAQRMIKAGDVGAGSMAPKLASASDYVLATSRPAHICGLADVVDAVAGRSGSGTVIAP